jgi:4-hydroxy-tetrahydrodipicolinate reductase
MEGPVAHGTSDVPVSLLGVGRLGRDLTRLLSVRAGVRVVSAWSRNPAHAGVDVGELAGIDALGVRVTPDRDLALGAQAQIAVIATTSFLGELAPTIEAAVRSGHNVLCSGEETAFPWAIDRDLAATLDRLARERGLTIVGGGANPGLIFDALVSTLALGAPDIERIRVSRAVDVSRFSATVLGRLGIGYTPEEFEAGRKTARIWGHIGFPQSMHVVASSLGLTLDRVDGTVEPLYAARPFSGEHVPVATGQSAGFVQRYVGVVRGREWFHAELTGHLDPAAVGIELVDSISIEGSVPLALKVEPGFRAQETSAAVLANSIARVVAAPPGWLTVAELPPAIARVSRRGGEPAGY